MKNKLRKVVALILSVIMILGMMDLRTYAGEVEDAVVMEQTEDVSENEEITVLGNQGNETENSGWDGFTTESIYKTEGYSVTFTLTSHWEGGYNATIKIENTSDTLMKDWYICFPFENEITNIWNAEITEHTEDIYIIKNAGWNQDIPTGESREFGFGGNENFAGFSETYEVLGTRTEMDMEEYEIQYKVTNDWGTGFNGNVTIKNLTKEPIEDWQVSFDFENEITNLWNGEIVSHEGTKYVVKNAGWNQNIAAGFTVSFGFTVGNGNTKNEITNLILEQITIKTEEIIDINKDIDGDGINNYFEIIFGTDKDKADTDGDNINDYDEFTKTGTDPITPDTDENGIRDGDEDFDKDGLNNLEELTYETNPYDEDSDGDGLLDGEEIKKHNTKPLDEDTDKDGLKDGEEILIGLNPMAKDSDEDGIPDNQEIIEQNYRITVSGGDDAVKSIEVEMTCNGYLGNQLSIRSVAGEDIHSTNVVGLVGVPFEIKTETAFDKALITVTYDKENLGDSKEENLCLAWYDKETKEYELLEEETLLDKENGTLSYYTDHFSTWLVIDAEKWRNHWEAYLEISKSTHDNQYETLSYEINGITHRYQLFEKHGSWKDAEEVCRMAGGYLATIQSEEENQIVYQYIRSQGCVSAYIGLTDEKTEGKWTWSNGEEVNYTKWYPGEPNGRRYENYAMFYYKYLNGHWNDGSFNIGNTQNDVSIFVCEWEEVENKEDSDGDGIPDYYEINGMILPNGEIIYSDPNSDDTDGDELTDYEEMFGEPKEKSVTVGGNEYKVQVWNMVSNPNLVDSDGDTYLDNEDYQPMKMALNSDMFCKNDYGFDKDALYQNEKMQTELNFGNQYKDGSFYKTYTLEEANNIYQECVNLVTNPFVIGFVNKEAVSNLNHYLSASGTELNMPINDIILSSYMVREDIQKIQQKLEEHIESVYIEGSNLDIRLRNYYLFQDFTKGENLMYVDDSIGTILAYGKFYGFMQIFLNDSVGDDFECDIKTKIHFFDYYDWNNNMNVAAWPMLPQDDEMYSLEQYALAKGFMCYGETEYLENFSLKGRR